MRKPLILSLAIVLAGFGAYCGYWFWTANLLQNGLERWKAEREREGYVIAHEMSELDGFPFSVILQLPAATITSPARWHWRSSDLRIRSNPLRPTGLTLALSGPQEISFASPGSGDESKVSARDSQMEVLFQSDGRASSGVGRLQDLSEQNPVGETLRGREVTFSFAQLSRAGASAAGDITELQVNARSFHFPQLRTALLGRMMSHLDITGEVLGPLPRDFSAAALAAWRNAGGLLRIERLDLDWQPLALSGKGQLRIDAEGSLSGQIDIWWRNLTELIDKAAGEGLLEVNAATGLKLALFALPSRRAADGGIERNLPLVFKSGGLFLGPVLIARIGPIL